MNDDLHERNGGSSYVVRIGGIGKEELLVRLDEAGVQLNEAGRTLFANHRFTTLPGFTTVEVVEVSVAMLGYEFGATFAQIAARAADFGLTLCPLELGPHLRLHLLDQSEGYLGQPPSQHRAPPGSLTVASEPIAEDVPRGFYLRRIGGVLGLRGYHCAAEHIWNPDDVFVFARPQRTT